MAVYKKKQPKPGDWSYTVGEPPHQVTAYERADRKLDIYTRVYDGKRAHSKKRLSGSIRDKSGNIVPALEIAAQQGAIERHGIVVAGVSDEVNDDGPVTLADGFRRLLDPKEGKYSTGGNHVSDVRRAGKTARDVLGAELLFGTVRHAHYRKLWRELARRYVRGEGGGLRMTEVVCEALASCARWLQQEGVIEPGDGEPARGWKTAMRKEWAEITGKPATGPAKPRHSQDEAGKLWAALDAADPRLALGMEIGAELRMGQVARTRRSDVHPSPDGSESLWMVRVHGRGKKRGEDVVLTEAQRQSLRAALTTGHLADLESAREVGEISDYFLMPSGHLVTVTLPDGSKVKRARVDRGDKPIGSSGLRVQWRALERAAGVKTEKGRRWYGMRRRQADEVDQMEGVAPAVKNRMGGWTKTSTREGYLESGRLSDAVEAAQVRSKTRPPKALGAVTTNEEPK